jgi:tetratricopeptide (TPR) repeat protein
MIVDRGSSGAEKGEAEGSVGEAWGAFAKALERSARGIILLLAIGLRPILDSLRVAGSPTVVPLWGILSSLGLVVGLSIAFTSIVFYTVDIDAAFRRVVGGSVPPWPVSPDMEQRGRPGSAAKTSTERISPRVTPSQAALKPNDEVASVSRPRAEGGAVVRPMPLDQPPTAPSTRVASPAVAALIASGKQAAVKAGLDKAFRDFTEAIRVDPDYPGSYAERGMILFKRGESERAIADYTAALTRDANYAPALRGRGMVHLYRGATDLAIADLTKAILLAENDPSRLSALDLFYARRSRAALYGEKQQYDGEIADCTAIIQSYRRDLALGDDLKATYGGGASSLIAMIYRQRANAYLQRSNNEAALADLTEALGLSADRFPVLLDRARVYEALGQRDQGVADAGAALRIRPDNEEAKALLKRSATPTKRPNRP